jgi:hypothetical protein
VPIPIIPKRSAVPGRAPRPDELIEGELAFNTTDGRLYGKMFGGTVVALNPPADTSGLEARLAALESALAGLEAAAPRAGDWLPQFYTTGSQPTVTYDGALTYGRYYRLGDLVYINARIKATSISGGDGFLLIQGLPFKVGGLPNGAPNQTAVTLGYVGGVFPSRPELSWTTGGREIYLGRFANNTQNGISLLDVDQVQPAVAPEGMDVVVGAVYVAEPL